MPRSTYRYIGPFSRSERMVRNPLTYLVTGSVFACGAVYTLEQLNDGESRPQTRYDNVLQRDLSDSSGALVRMSAGVNLSCHDDSSVTTVDVFVDVALQETTTGETQGRSLPPKVFVFDDATCQEAQYNVLRRNETTPESMLGSYVLSELAVAGGFGSEAHGYAATGRTILSYIENSLDEGARLI